MERASRGSRAKVIFRLLLSRKIGLYYIILEVL